MVINWFPYSIPVVVTKMAKGDFGEFLFFPSPVIMISEDIKSNVLSSTLLHEIFEMINAVHDLGLTESKIRTLEVALSQIMCRNPEVTRLVFPESSESDPGDEDTSRSV
jgi:hypothetical protein